ncbi:MAG TPA: hypothetical protein VFV01_04255 [Spirillospora sp.]|nr:hypothetical protein [Spirillospora sp.]
MFVRAVDEPDAERLVDGLAGLRARVLEHPHKITQSGDEGLDLLSAQDPAPLNTSRAEFGLGCDELRFGLGHPLGDGHRVGAGLERGAVAREFGLTVGDLGLGTNRGGVGRRLLGTLDVGDRLLDAVRRQDLREPGIDEGGDLVFADEDVARVLDPVGQRVLLRVAAPEVDVVLVGVCLHLAVAQAAVDDAAQRVGVFALRPGLGPARLATAGCELALDAVEDVLVDDDRMDDLLGEDPLVAVVPAEFGDVAERDVVDVDEDLVLALPVPDLVAGVAGVGQNGLHSALGPGQSLPVPVACPVMGRRTGNAVSCQPLGDGEQSLLG